MGGGTLRSLVCVTLIFLVEIFDKLVRLLVHRADAART